MKKLILLCTVFVGVIANAYINEDNEYAPNPTAKEIVIYDSGDAPKQEVASKDFANDKRFELSDPFLGAIVVFSDCSSDGTVFDSGHVSFVVGNTILESLSKIY